MPILPLVLVCQGVSMKQQHQYYSVILVLLLPASALAETAWPIYALSNADTLYGVLNGMAALMSSRSFANALIIFGLMGFFWAIVLAAMHRNYTRLIIYLLTVTVFIQFALKQQVNVEVISQTDGKTYAVSHVPTLIALPASWMSTLGFEGARSVDAAYATVAGMSPDLTLTSGKPFSISNQLLQDASHYRLQDVYLRASLIHFIADCGVPMLAQGSLSLTDLLGSHNVWSLFNTTSLNPALETVDYGNEKQPVPQGRVMTCLQAYQAINSRLSAAQNQMIKQLSPELGAGVAAELFQSVLAYHASNHLYSPSPGDYLQQAALLDLLNGPVQRYLASSTHSAALMQHLAVEQATRATELNWQTTAEVFARTFGYLYTVVQLLVYAVAPILCLLAVFPGAMRTLGKRYVMLLAWFPLTFMMLAISNDLIVSWTHNEVGNVFGQFGGLAQHSQALITEKAAKLQAVGAYIVSLVPLLAWAILEGGQYAISQIITHSGAQTFGHQAGLVAASGNMSLDSQQYHSVSANKFSTTQQVDIGAVPVSSQISGGDTLNRAHFGGASVSRNSLPDMMQFSDSIQSQSSEGVGETSQVDRSGSVADGSGLSDQANVSESLANTTETRLGGGLNLSAANIDGKALKAAGQRSAEAVMAAAKKWGVPMTAAMAGSIGMGMANAEAASELSVQAQQQGKIDEADEYRQLSQHMMQDVLKPLKYADYKGVVIGGLVAAGAVGLLASGVGVLGAAAEGIAEGAAAAMTGESLAIAATEEGIAAAEMEAGMAEEVGEAAQGVKVAEEAAASQGSKAGKWLKKGALGGFLNGVSGQLNQSYSGSHNTRLDDNYSANHHLNADKRDSYSDSQKTDQHQQVSTSTSRHHSYSMPDAQYYRQLNMVGEDAGVKQSMSPIHKAQQQIQQADATKQITADELKAQIDRIRGRADTWGDAARKSIKQRSGINQLPKSDQQKKAGDYRVTE